jgi:fibronectin-binding autotransporter adhesin
MSNVLREAGVYRGLPYIPQSVPFSTMASMKNRSAFAPAFARRDLITLVLAIAVCVCSASTAKAQVTTLLDLENTPGQGYTLYTFSIQAQLAQTFLTFEFRQDPAYWRLDDVSVTSSVGTELLLNGGFENGSYGGQDTPNDWTLIGQAGLDAGGRVSGGCAHSGIYCYNDGAVGGVDGLYQAFSTTIGATYSLSFWLANDGGAPTSAVVQVGASLDQGGVLVPPPPTVTATDIVSVGSPFAAAGLGTTLNPVFDGGTLQLDGSGPVFAQDFAVNATNGTIDAAGLDSTLSGVLSGPGGLTFTNSAAGGSILLTNTNSYQGSTTIDSGTTLMLSGAGSIAASSGLADDGTFDVSALSTGASIQSLSGNGTVVLGSQTLTLTNASDTFAGVIGGSGGLTLSGGAETLSGVNLFTGATSIGSGATLALSGAGSIAASSSVIDNGSFDISGTSAGASIQSLSGNGSVALGNQTLTLTNASDNFAGVIGGAGGVTLSGGSESLSGTNTYQGSTIISIGTTLSLTGTGSIAASSGVVDKGTFDISATTGGAAIQSLSGQGVVALGSETLSLTNASDTFAGVIGGSGGLTVSGGAQSLSGSNTFTGATGIASDAALSLRGGGSIATSSGVLDNGVFDISNTTAGASIQSLAGNGGVTLGNQTLTVTNGGGSFAGVIGGTGGIAVIGGTETLGGINLFSGITGIGSGATLALSGAGSITASSGVTDNGVFDISSSSAGAAIQSLTGSGMVSLGNQTLTLSNARDTFSGVIAGLGGLALTGGTEALNGTNTFRGGITLSGGSLLIVGTDAALGDASGVLTLNAATLQTTASFAMTRDTVLTGDGTFLVNAGSSLHDTGALSGTGELIKSGAGTLELCGSVSNAGATSVLAGTLAICGNDGATGVISVAGGATLNVTGAGSIAAAGGVADNGRLDISASSAGTTIQSLSGAGAVALGNQTLTLNNGAATFAGSIAGTGGLNLSGGSEVLSGINAFSGSTGIGSGATLALSGTGSVATSSQVADNGSFDVSGSAADASIQSLSGNGTVILGSRNLSLTNASGTFGGAIGGAGSLNLTGGTETLAGANVFSGATGIGSGATLALSGTGSIAASSNVSDAGTLDIAATTTGASIKALTGDGSVALGNQTLTLTNAGGSFAGTIGGAGGLAITGGNASLTGINTYSGATSVGIGTGLSLTGVGSISHSSEIADNGTVDISGAAAPVMVQSLSGGGNVVLGAQILALTRAQGQFSGSIAGTGGVAIIGGTESLTGTNAYTGGTLVSNATLIISGDRALGATAGTLTLSNSTLENTASIDTARSITLLGSNTLSTDAGSTLTQSGEISGSGHLMKTGDGTLVLDSDNRNWGQQGNNASGGLTINSGLVEVENPYALGYGLIAVNNAVIATTVDILTGQTIQLSGATVLNVDSGTTTTLTGTVQTTGIGACFEKTGTGTLIMSGTATLGNGTCIEAGQLDANGSINSAVSVASAATLRGLGLITGAVTVQGTLAPGNSPGTLSVAGNVTMLTGSVYQEDINGAGSGTGPHNYSRLLVAGSTNEFVASGASLNVNLLNITGAASYTPFQPSLGQTFTIVTAQGGIVGKFASFDQPLGLAENTRLAIFYDPLGDNSIDLRVVPSSYSSFLQAAGANNNARSAGTAMNQILAADQAGGASVAQDEFAFAVSGISASALPNLMSALAGELHADLAAVVPQAGQWLQLSVARQLEFSDADGEWSTPLPGRAFWFDTTANHGKWDSDSQASRFTTNRSQSALGFDLMAGQGNRLGIGYSHSLIDVSTDAGSGSVDENLAFIYGQFTLAPVILDGMVAGGSNRWETNRADPLAPSSASLDTNRHGNTALASLGIRFPARIGGIELEPYARTLWQRATRTGFDEGSALDALSGPNYSATGLRTLVGMVIGPKNSSPLAAQFGYQINVGAGYDSGALLHPQVAAVLAGTAMTIMAPEVGRTLAEFSVDGTARLGTQTYIYAGLMGEARSGKAEDAGINAGVRANF